MNHFRFFRAFSATAVAVLVLAMFLVFIALALNRRKVVATAPTPASKAVPALLGGDYVDGFLTPTTVSYHCGHTWVVSERKNVVRMGADEFATALVGKIDHEIPYVTAPGRVARQLPSG